MVKISSHRKRDQPEDWSLISKMAALRGFEPLCHMVQGHAAGPTSKEGNNINSYWVRTYPAFLPNHRTTLFVSDGELMFHNGINGNNQKNSRCSITVEELYERINLWEEKYSK